MSDLQDVKRQVAIANRVLAEVGLATVAQASLGHASMRVPSDPNRFVVKGRGYELDALARMKPDDMVVCDLEGYKVDGPPGVTQCFEVKMHSCIYKTRPEVQGVVHVHPQYSVVMSVLRATLKPMCISGINLVRRPLPVYPHVNVVQSEEEGMEVARLLGKRHAILLLGHGVTTAGRSLAEAVMNALWLEEQAKMNWYAYCAAGADYPAIPDYLVEELVNRPTLDTLPHLKEHFKEEANQLTNPKIGGAWQAYLHYAELVSRDL